MSDYKRKFTLRIDEDIMNKIDLIAAKNKRSINAHIEFVLEKQVEEFEKQNGKIEIEKD